MDSIPIAPRTAAANGQYSTVIFHCAELDVVLVGFHLQQTSNAQPAFARIRRGGARIVFKVFNNHI